MDEKVFFESNGVTVTHARFLVRNQTYAMSGITSVKITREAPSRTGPVIVALIGLALTGGAPFVGLPVIVAAICWWVKQQTKHHIVLVTSGGEQPALWSADPRYVKTVYDALNAAIIARG